MQRCSSYAYNENSSSHQGYSTRLHHMSMSLKERRLLLFTKYNLEFHFKTLILKFLRDSLKVVLTNTRNPSDSKKERLKYIRESKQAKFKNKKLYVLGVSSRFLLNFNMQEKVQVQYAREVTSSI